MDRYEEMKTFVHIVDSGGISHAADQLGIAKSAVSRRLSDLESRLSIQLFNRSTRKFSLTDTGQSYYDECIRLLNDLEEVEASVISSSQKLTGKLRITAPLSFGLGHLGPVITDFIAKYPDVRIELDLNDREVNLIEENYDLSLRIGVLEDSQLIARKLFRMNLVPLASPEYLKKQGTPITPQELEKHPMIGYMISSGDYLHYTAQDGTQGSINPRISHSCSNGDFMRKLVLSGLGFAILPTFLAYQQIEKGVLIPLLIDYSWGRENAYAVYPSTRHLSYRVRAFVDYLLARFQGTPYWNECLEPRHHP